MTNVAQATDLQIEIYLRRLDAALSGMGGTYSLKLPEISAPILERKLVPIKNSGAPVAVMDCPGCVMQIRGGLDKQNSTIKAEHTAQRLVDELE